MDFPDQDSAGQPGSENTPIPSNPPPSRDESTTQFRSAKVQYSKFLKVMAQKRDQQQYEDEMKSIVTVQIPNKPKIYDTLVYIDPPAPRSEMICPPSSVPYPTNSQKLLESGSPIFKKMFQPIDQARVIRARGLMGKLASGIEYVLDLTPPSMEESAAVFLIELSCPLGVRAWASAKDRWILPETCVGGDDELEEPESNTQGDDSKKTSLPVDYSPFRHRAGIKDVVRALEGSHVPIDTPCKMWTFFSLAWLFDVATTPVICDRILSWLYNWKNALFREINPEVTYRIACGIQSATLCQETFAILVGEEALLLLANADKPTSMKRPQTTFHGRIRESLKDTEIQRIEYAGQSFMEYAVNRFIYLAGNDMHWLGEVNEYRKLLSTPNAHSQALQSSLMDYVRGYLFYALHKGGDMWMKVQLRSTLDRNYPHPAFQDTYRHMRYAERLMSRTFWRELVTQDFNGDWTVHFQNSFPPATIADLAEYQPTIKTQTDARIRYVNKGELETNVRVFNNSLLPPPSSQHAPAQTFEHELAFRPKVDSASDDIVSTSIDTTTSLEATHGAESNSDGSDAHYDPVTNDLFHMDLDEIASTANDTWDISDPWRPILIRDTGTYWYNLDQNEHQFNLSRFLNEARDYVQIYANEMLKSPADDSMPYELTDTLTCLREQELKFLPLWAGGDDDESYGVFNDEDIPIVESDGFSGPGPSIHTGSCASVDSFSEIGTVESTVQGASHNATESHLSDVISLDSRNSNNRDTDDDAASEGSVTVIGSPTLSDFMDEDAELDIGDDSDSDNESFEEI